VSTTHPFGCDVAWAVGRDVAGGYADNTFRPTAPVTRQAMAAFLHGMLADGGAPPDPGFVDVPDSHPFQEEIAWLVDAGIAQGYPDNTFKPAAPISRQAMAAFMYRAAGAPLGDDPTCAAAPFPDVPASHAFCGEIAWLADEGITTGYDDGTFRPGATVTRQATVALLQRLRSHVLF
jgi:endo-1,4-beta-xylanase